MKGKVFVGLSGGVDSAVSAALLKREGHDVTGVFIKVWQPDFLECTWRDERRDAMRVAAALDIPFLFFDFEKEYKQGVADYMIEEYRKGRTPNPDVMCNREIKFGAFWKKAKAMGADFIATGHYAQIDGATLIEGKDANKDQTYFLWTLTPEDLSHVLFPIGHLDKKEVRELAKKCAIPVAEKKDSQGICFLGHVDIEEFLSYYIDIPKGDVIDLNGTIIGRHNGAVFYTQGERHGFEIFTRTPDAKPYFVIDKNIEKNTITVSDSPHEIASHLSKDIAIENANWIEKPHLGSITARVRYRQEKFAVIVKGDRVEFSTPQIAASGQSIVFYQNSRCIGGGVIV